MKIERIKEILNGFEKKKILCVGDIVLDRFVYGSVERTSREAPIPILVKERQNTMLGGAANAAANLKSLGAEVLMVGVLGKDETASTLSSLVKEILYSNDGLITDPTRPTTEKIRFLSSNQQLFRADTEVKTPISKEVEDKLVSFVEKHIKNTNGIMLSDYGLGVITPSLAKRVIDLANQNKIPLLVDPRGKNFSKYDGATVVKPNKQELEEISGLKIHSDEDAETAGEKVLSETKIQNIITTRSADGMSVISRGQKAKHLKTTAKEVYDVSGAGDTVAATLLLSMVAGATLEESAVIGNIAGGLVVAKIGTAVLRTTEIQNEAEELLVGNTSKNAPQIPGLTKLSSRTEALEKIDLWRAKGFKIGFTNGYFDLMHPGHLSLFAQAKKKCDRLVVGLNSDKSFAQNKKGEKLIQDEMARAAVLGCLEQIDMIIHFDEASPLDLIKAINPDVFIKGNNQNIKNIPEADYVISQGKEVFLADVSAHQSSLPSKVAVI